MMLRAALLCGVLLLAGCGAGEPVMIGYLGGLSGRTADLGEAGRNGVQLAVDAANAAGGIDGRRIELVIRDDAHDPAQARAAVAAFARDGVAVVIGPMTSAMAVAVLEPSARAGLLLVSPTVTASALSGRDDHLFKVSSSSRVHARLAAESQFRQGHRRVAVLYDLGNAAYSEDVLSQFRAAFVALGGAVVAAEPFTSGQDASYGAAVQRLRGVAADALHLIAGAADTVRLLQLARASGLAQPASTAPWAGTEQLIELGGGSVEGLRLAQFFDRDHDSPAYRSFRATYRARYQREPGFASVAAYDATRAVIVAMQARRQGQSLKAALLAAGPFAGLQQVWGFDRHGDAERGVWVAEVRDGRFQRVR